MTPKSLLRNRLAVSTLEDFTKEFQPLIPDEQQKSSVSKLVFVSGKVYYDLVNKRNSLDDKGSGIAIVRLEMIYPFPYDQVKQEILKYKGAEVIWCQEEHKNMGAYSFVSPHIQEILAELKIDKTLKYVGRYSAPSPAVGYPKLHEKEQNEIINQIFG